MLFRPLFDGAIPIMETATKTAIKKYKTFFTSCLLSCLVLYWEIINMYDSKEKKE
jgi:hypothetical protein